MDALRFYVPALGTKMTLAEDWTFDLYHEYRNYKLAAALKITFPEGSRWATPAVSESVTLPAGTELTIRRYYIRQGQGDFDSVTFSAKIGKKSHRFWVKLADANNIHFDDCA